MKTVISFAVAMLASVQALQWEQAQQEVPAATYQYAAADQGASATATASATAGVSVEAPAIGGITQHQALFEKPTFNAPNAPIKPSSIAESSIGISKAAFNAPAAPISPATLSAASIPFSVLRISCFTHVTVPKINVSTPRAQRVEDTPT